MIRRGVLPVPRLDLVVLVCALSLAVLGVLFVASATTGTRFEGLASRQAIWLAVGAVAMGAAILFDYRMLLKFSFAIYCVCLVPLVYLLLFGDTIANVRSWIRVGHFQFQPAELSKIATALLVAYLFQNEDDARLHGSTLVKLGAIVGIPILLVFLQPDMGLAITFLPLLFVGLYSAVCRPGAGPRSPDRTAGGRPWSSTGITEGADRDLPNRTRTWRRRLPGPPGQEALVWEASRGKGFSSGTKPVAFLTVQQRIILAVIAEEWGFLGIVLFWGCSPRCCCAR